MSKVKASVKKILPPNIKMAIKGRMVMIKPISIKEVGARYVNWLNNPKINEFLEVRRKKQTIKDVINYINGLRSKKGCEIFAIFVGDEHVGNITIIDYNKHDLRAYLGLLVGEPKAQAMGAGCEALILLMEYLFKNVKTRKISTGVIGDNERSHKLMKNLGFVKEGTQRKHYILSPSKIVDGYVYGILKKEWTVQKKKVNNILKNYKVTKP